MSVAVEKLEKNMAKLTIEVSAEELEKAIQGAYQKQKNRITAQVIKIARKINIFINLWVHRPKLNF